MPQKSKGKADFKRTALFGPVIFALVILGFFYQSKITEWFGSDQQQ